MRAASAADRSESSKQSYEDGMFAGLSAGCHATRCADDGRLVVVFANKQPEAWETLVSALIRAGFVVTGLLARSNRAA